MPVRKEKVGLWIIGACGAVGSTVALGVAAFRKRLTSSTGLVSELPVFRKAELVAPGSITIGGHEIRGQSLLEAVKGLHEQAHVFDPKLIHACAPLLGAMQRNIKPGSLCGSNPMIRKLADPDFIPHDRSAADAVERLTADLNDFRRRHKLDHVVVVYAASSEPATPRTASYTRFDKLRGVLRRSGSSVLATSSLYALAAVEARCAFINFTPAPGISVPAIQERAAELQTAFMGNDGKTGETLVKSVVAPMFATRNLRVLSWVGQNILGNRDGAVLKDPKTRASKIKSKDKVLSQILGSQPVTHVSIDFVPSLNDWKVAWDFIHFQGFLDTKMSMQFTWQGSDSILAAPLIIDLTRLTASACRTQQSGALRHLAFFFKDPIGVDRLDLFSQWQRLVSHVKPDRPGTE